MRVLVCGGRDFADERAVWRALYPLGRMYGPVTIVHGAARGADSLAGRIADRIGYEVETYPADWKAHGKAAGPIRNRQMLATGIDLVVAFPGGRGTDHMKKIAREAGVDVYEVSA